MPLTPRTLLATLVALPAVFVSPPAAHAEEHAKMAALASIRAEDALAHLEVLASDALEGRRGGSRGGRAAAAYLVKQLQEMGWQGGGTEDDYYQPFSGGRRNVLAVWPGSDDQLKHEHIVIGAHYDHVGYGDRRTSFGPIGYIHNGADDNASGVSAVLEFAQAVALHEIEPKRSLIIAFWDAEELGLLGSQHWCNRPTVPLESVPLSINIDMVGRMREGRLEVSCTRSGAGLRRLASVAADDGVWLDFTWELENNSDHWNFLQRRVPTLMLHTGLHDDYHRPSDDVSLINTDGVRLTSRYLFDLALTAADADELPKFRWQGMNEGKSLQARRQRPLPPLPEGAPAPRVGISWREDDGEPGAVFLTRVAEGTPASEAGLQVHDRILHIDGQPFANSRHFQELLNERLAEDAEEIALQIERRGRVEHTVISGISPAG
ncbi:Aminopeptidase S [Posidoniimonas polymericola]|uniref:Aminopeptidase S n=1 Tax=Posidoniimonas polymericola TaxID=2528002 RepID=A0A5C5YQ54_9BACT|nr:M28 family peptidase [Posidoniimonas polymericola]TWT77071.1 Aminopeptidase S [Posidoniimonas polymericola]